MRFFIVWAAVLAACGIGFLAPVARGEAKSDYAITIRVQDSGVGEEQLKQLVETAVREALRERKGDVQSVDIEQVSATEQEGREKIYGKLFDPLIADPRWPHFSASYQRYRRVSRDIGSANFGGWFATPPADAPFEGNWQLGIQGGVFSIFDLGAASKDLINADYFVALPTFSYRKDDFSLLARLFHQSSHLGDEFILFNEITPQERVNLSYEAVDLLLSYDLDFLGQDVWRIYGGGAYLFHIDPEDVDPWWIQYGLEFDSQWVFPDKVTVVEEPDQSGETYLHVMTGLKGGEWILAYRQRAKDAYSVIHSTRALAGLIFVLGVLGIVGMAVFLSRKMVHKISEADLQKEMMNEQVIEAGKLASVGELAAGIAHEINNPVAIMVEEAGWIEDLLDDEDLKQAKSLEEFKRALQQIRTQGKRCKQITQKLLSFARKTEPMAENVQLNELVEEVVALSQQRARYSNVKLVSDLAEDLPTVDVSPSEIQQVLLNLINNSLDALDTKGGKVRIATRVKGNQAVIDVEDDGPGIPKANLSRIFDPFFTTKPVGKGTGLGLSICYGIVKKIGGEITVNSAPGIGTAFHVHIPVHIPKTDQKGPVRATGSA